MTNIDREVTEEIFQECWHEYSLVETTYDKHIIARHYKCDKCNKEVTAQGFWKWRDNPPSYSTSWEAMGRLIEKMRELGYLVLLQQAPRPDAKAFCGLQNRQKTFKALADTPQMAVAMAALKAKRGE